MENNNITFTVSEKRYLELLEDETIVNLITYAVKTAKYDGEVIRVIKMLLGMEDKDNA